MILLNQLHLYKCKKFVPITQKLCKLNPKTSCGKQMAVGDLVWNKYFKNLLKIDAKLIKVLLLYSKFNESQEK